MVRLALFKSAVAGRYVACLRMYCRKRCPSGPNLLHRGLQILHQPTGMIHLLNISSVHSLISPKNGYFAHYLLKYVEAENQPTFIRPQIIFVGRTAP